MVADMREMKDSGIDWIGNIPEIWSINKIKYIVQSRSVKYRLSKVGNYIGLENVESSSGHYVKSETEYVDAFYDGCEAGDLLYGKLRPNLAKVLISPYKSCCTGEFEIISSSLVGKKFLQYYMLTEEFTQAATQLTYGAKMPRVNWDDVKEFKIAYPNANEISTIVSFLDSKCSEIDSLAADIQAQIDTLEQYKRSVITEAVTKGLDKNVPMKDSGIEWIGEIPKSASISKVKYEYNIVLGKMVSKGNDGSLGDNYLCAANIRWSGVNTDINRKMYFSPSEKIQYLLEKNDVLIMEGGATAGTTCIYREEFEPCYIQNSVIRCRAKDKTTNAFLYYWMVAVNSVGYIDQVKSVATIPHFTKEKVSATPIVTFPAKETTEIITYLDNKCAEIDNIISSKQKQLSVLADYKKSLIYEYVTGKKEVPNE